jgi:SAM-dependent methyltransferase
MSHSSEGALDTDGRVDTPSSLFGIGLLSAALMATEIALTRVLSVTIWYHFAFFAISVALLGTGLAALLVHALQARLFARGWRAWCGLFSLLQALSTLLVTLGLARVSPDWFGGMSGAFTLFTWKLSLVFGLAVLPFACGGMVIATVTARAGSAMHRVYFVDLVGAALGCLITIPLLSWLGGPNALVACAGMATLVALVFAWPVSSERARRARGMLGAGACVLVLLELVCAGSSATELRSAKGVDLTRVKPELTRWNSSSLVNVFGEQGFRGWGLSPRFTGTLPAQKTLIIDMSALTPITRFDGDFSRVDYVRYDLSSLVYRVFPVRERAAEVCVVGAGGGKDVLSALAAGSKHVTGVEINPLIVNDVMRGAYRTFSGGLYDRPDVDIVEGDGRGFLRGTQRKFDVILISMVDTSAATAAGAYALTENGLYTREAFEEFLARLRPGGVLTVSTVSLPGLAVGARLAATARAAVLARGGKPNESVAVAHTPWVTRSDSELDDLLIKPDGFSSDELERFMHSLIELDFAPGFVPRRSFASPRAEDRLVDAILRARSDAELERTLRAYPLDATAVSDDRPFFFYQNRFSDFVDALLLSDTQHLFGNGLRVLAKVLVLAFVMLLACAVLPLVWLRSGRALQADLAYAACLGVGFMCIEIALVHRVTLFLGQPTYTLVAVLFVLLCAGGLGSRWLAPRLSIWGSRAALVFVVIAAAAALLPAVSDALFFAMRSAALPVRACVAAVAIAPVGWLLGAPLPAGFARVSTVDDSRVAWLWGVNGAASVFGSILATLTALHAGTRITLWVGAAAYLLAALLWRRLWR